VVLETRSAPLQSGVPAFDYLAGCAISFVKCRWLSIRLGGSALGVSVLHRSLHGVTLLNCVLKTIS
jgi:hypothetical protein